MTSDPGSETGKSPGPVPASPGTRGSGTQQGGLVPPLQSPLLLWPSWEDPFVPQARRFSVPISLRHEQPPKLPEQPLQEHRLFGQVGNFHAGPGENNICIYLSKALKHVLNLRASPLSVPLAAAGTPQGQLML